jgi:hypothetical protein
MLHFRHRRQISRAEVMNCDPEHNKDRIPEIEITPDMIAAGVTAFLDFDGRFESEADAVADIYRAMVWAKEGYPDNVPILALMVTRVPLPVGLSEDCYLAAIKAVLAWEDSDRLASDLVLELHSILFQEKA